MHVILFWTEVEEDDEEKEISVFLGVMKREEDEEEEKEISIFSGVMKREEDEEMVNDHLWAAKIRSRLIIQ
jgi:hypothetical protein